jgi:diguanylate cyclase (GGDEF)-like protein
MKKWTIALLAIFSLGTCAGARAASTNLRSLRLLTNDQAMKRLPVEFKATVTYYRDYDIDLFVQDGDSAIYVHYRAGARLVPGDRVLVRGRTQDSFRPIVVADDVTVLRHGPVPWPVPTNAAAFYSAQRDCVLGSVRGTVRSAQMVSSAGHRNIYLQVLIDGGYIDAAVNSDNSKAMGRLLDSEIEMTGVITSNFDQKMQTSGARLDVQSLHDIRILKPAATRPQDLPVTPMENVFGGYRIEDFSRRIQVKGTITYYQPRRGVVLQTKNQSLWIVTQTDVPLEIGNIAYASGFPNVRNGYLTLDHGEIRDTHQKGSITPQSLSWDQIGSGQFAFMLVSAEGELVSEAREAAQDEYVFTSHGHLFSAIYRHPGEMSAAELPAMKHMPAGSRVRVSGINFFFSSDPFDGPVESNLLLRDIDDIDVIGGPPLLSKRNLEIVIGVLFLAIFGFAARGWLLERRMRRHTALLAARTGHEAEIERRRGQILEKIHGTGPLDEILKMIADLSSFRLGGVPCCCETRDGARFGASRDRYVDANVIGEEIRDGSGTCLGYFSACLPPDAKPGLLEHTALVKGAGMAALAIETRGLYADLVRRSEFDNLTDAHSRFYLERELDNMIELAKESGGIFGLIYFDLDGFKRVNDTYGHRVGDELHQNVARRIKSQLRAQDKLARLGGDEFAVLVPPVRNLSDLLEIQLRLRACMDEPIVVEGTVLRSSASFGLAIYPQDGTTRDELIDRADAAMYCSKLAKR